MEHLQESSTLTFCNTTGDSMSLGCSGTYYNPYDLYNKWSNYHYYSYPYYITEKSKFDTSFKVVSKLIEKKIIKTLTVKQFIELVNEIAKEI